MNARVLATRSAACAALLVILSAANAVSGVEGPAIGIATAWIRSQQLPDGAILYGTNEIQPYYANIAAMGLVRERARLPNARAWMNWYVTHLNARDRWGLSGTMYDYRYSGGVETSLRKADSVDSYAATFFTLARALYDTGDTPSQAYVVSIRRQLEEMAAMLPHVTQRDGMTIALPTYPVAYLMDDSEVYRGLTDLAYLERHAFADVPKARLHEAASRRVAAGIATLWSRANGTYDSGKQEPHGPWMASRWSRWYPDATAQLFPVLQGVIPATSPRAGALWNAFGAAWPRWDQLVNGDTGGYPWALVGETALIVGDASSAETFANAVQKRYAAAGFPYPWYDAEAGWYVQMLAGLDRQGAAEPRG
jgi:hypothetical protein